MGILELILIAIGLSMDAFAVAVCKGLKMYKLQYKQLICIAVFFGGFQALMPLIGWFVGKQFESYISAFDHWIAFALLVFIGGKMLLEALSPREEETDKKECLNLKELTILAFATSIDALAVGITFAIIEVSIVSAISIIGIITLFLCAIGVFVGHRFGKIFGNKAEILGGSILILIGLKILLEHLGVLNF